MAAVILTMAAGSLAGPYVTTAVGYYRAGIGGQIPSHGVILNAGATVDFFISTLNVLYVPTASRQSRLVTAGTRGLVGC